MKNIPLQEKIKQIHLAKFLLIVLFIFLILYLSGVMIVLSNGKNQKFRGIPMSVHAQENADYRSEIFGGVLPLVDISIVRAVLKDEKVDGDEIEARMSKMLEELRKPVPETISPNVSLPIEQPNTTYTQTPTKSITAKLQPTATKNTKTITQLETSTQTIFILPLKTPTRTSTNFSFISATVSPTSTQTRTKSFTPTNTSTNAPTLIPTPTLTPTMTSTNTPTYTPIKTPTFTPTPPDSPTMTPTYTPTHTPTMTPTITQIFTPTITPTNTQTFSPTMTATHTPTMTPTYTPTNTSTNTTTISPTVTLTHTTTPTPAPTTTEAGVFCNNNPDLEIIGYFYPINGSENISLTINPIIFFNQSMDLATFTYGDENHVVLCQKFNENADVCQPGTEVNATVEMNSLIYRNNIVVIKPQAPLERDVLYTLFVGNQIKVHPQCPNIPIGARIESNFRTIQ